MTKKFSLILGGGAARGLAHIGVIKRLEELDNIPGLIVGTSMGAVIGAFYADGYSSAEILAIAGGIRLIDLLDIDIKKGGIKWKKIETFFEKYFGERQFSELKIPLKIIATNIDTGEKVIFTEGRIIDAVRASISIPWVFSPTIQGNYHLVDGGVVSNLPIEESLPWCPVIAFSVQMKNMFSQENQISELFWKNFFTYSYHILSRTIQLMMIENEKHSHITRPDSLLLSLGRDDIEYYDFHRVDELVDAGYMSAISLSQYLSDYEQK
jgi:NTE family protein